MWNQYSDRLRFASISTLVACLAGLYLATIYFGGSHIWFFISAPLATFFPCYFLWTWTIRTRKDYKIIYMSALGIMLTVITHYFNFVILGLGRLLCFYLGWHQHYESLFETLTYTTYLRMCISLYYTGLLTFILFTLIGIYVIKSSRTEQQT